MDKFPWFMWKKKMEELQLFPATGKWAQSQFQAGDKN